MPAAGMETVTVPGAFDGWVTLIDKYGTMKLADLLAPAIAYAEDGFPVMEKTADDWQAEVPKLRKTPAAAAHYLVDGRAPRAGEMFRQKNLANTFRILGREGRDAFYKGEIARSIADYCKKMEASSLPRTLRHITPIGSSRSPLRIAATRSTKFRPMDRASRRC